MLIVIAINVSIATYTPNLPISLAIVSNLFYNGVASSSIFSFSSAIPDLEFTPTAHTIAIPYPLNINVFPNKNGFGLN
jgi:hypothetical protein